MTRKKGKASIFKRMLLITECSAVVLLLLLCAYKNNIPIVEEILGETKPDIVLDAGHGGFDSGAIYDDYYEKDITLEMTMDIGKMIEEAGYRVLYTRDSDDVDWADDEKGDLAYRGKVSNQSGAKLFVSIHINSEEYDEGTSGYEVWADMGDDVAVTLANNILEKVEPLDYSYNRGVQDERNYPLYLIYGNKIPAILLEAGFMGSANDQLYLFDSTYQKQFSTKIAEGIIKTLEDMQKVEDASKKVEK